MSDSVVIRIAYEKMCEALNELIAECYKDEGRQMAAPNWKTVARLRAMLPHRYSMAYKGKAEMPK